MKGLLSCLTKTFNDAGGKKPCYHERPSQIRHSGRRRVLVVFHQQQNAIAHARFYRLLSSLMILALFITSLSGRLLTIDLCKTYRLPLFAQLPNRKKASKRYNPADLIWPTLWPAPGNRGFGVDSW